MINVLYVNNEDRTVGGATLSLMNLMHSVREEVRPTVLLREDGVVGNFLRSEGYEVIVIPFQRGTFNGSIWKKVFRTLPHLLNVLVSRRKTVRRALTLLKDRDIRLVHSNSGTVDIGLYIARALGVPHLWHLREYMDLDFGQRPFLGFRRFGKKLLSSEGVLAISSGIFEHFSLENHPCARWINDAVRPASDRLKSSEKEKYFLFSASLFSPAKQPETAVLAFCLSGVFRSGYRLRLTGHCSDEMKESLTSIAASYCASEYLDFVDFTADIKSQMERASGFLMTSRSEGLGRVTVEAMFYGCPVIARRSGGSLDILEDGRTGILFSTTEECAEAIRSLSERFPSEMVEAAGDVAVERFSEEAYGPKIMDFYKTLLG